MTELTTDNRLPTTDYRLLIPISKERNVQARNRTLFSALLLAFSATVCVLAVIGAPGDPSAVAQAIEAQPSDVRFGLPATLNNQQGEVRRESVVKLPTGQPRLTGPASVFRPLLDPIFGPNYRANTDTQTPNLAQQEPSIGVNPTNPLNVVVAAKDEREAVNSKHVYIYPSTDGGVTWINQRFPYRLPAPPYSSDPVVNFRDDGVVYVTSLPYGGGTAGIQVARSTDGGITFAQGTQVTSNPNSDKEWTWIDNNPASP